MALYYTTFKEIYTEGEVVRRRKCNYAVSPNRNVNKLNQFVIRHEKLLQCNECNHVMQCSYYN